VYIRGEKAREDEEGSKVTTTSLNIQQRRKDFNGYGRILEKEAQ
jgi:hypothetical protein